MSYHLNWASRITRVTSSARPSYRRQHFVRGCKSASAKAGAGGNRLITWVPTVAMLTATLAVMVVSGLSPAGKRGLSLCLSYRRRRRRGRIGGSRTRNQSRVSKPVRRSGVRRHKCLKAFRLVGAAGFEPATTRTPSVCATSLRHAPTACSAYSFFFAATRGRHCQ